jgi:hypothetical protein
VLQARLGHTQSGYKIYCQKIMSQSCLSVYISRCKEGFEMVQKVYQMGEIKSLYAFPFQDRSNHYHLLSACASSNQNERNQQNN